MTMHRIQDDKKGNPVQESHLMRYYCLSSLTVNTIIMYIRMFTCTRVCIGRHVFIILLCVNFALFWMVYFREPVKKRI